MNIERNKLVTENNERTSHNNACWRGHKVTVYNETRHIKMLEEVFSDGGLPVHFCAEANIDKDTLSMWLETYPEFKEAYEVFIVRSEALWAENMKLAKFSFKYWYFVMRNVFGYENLNVMERCEDMTSSELMNTLLEGISDGQFTDEQAKLFLNIINEKVRMENKAPGDDVKNLSERIKEFQNQYLLIDGDQETYAHLEKLPKAADDNIMEEIPLKTASL